MFFKGYIKICKTAAPIQNYTFLLTVKSVVKKVITRAMPGRSLVTYMRILSQRIEIFYACQCMAMMNATEEYFTFFSCGVCWNKTAIFHTGWFFKKVGRQYVCCCSAELLQ